MRRWWHRWRRALNPFDRWHAHDFDGGRRLLHRHGYLWLHPADELGEAHPDLWVREGASSEVSNGA